MEMEVGFSVQAVRNGVWEASLSPGDIRRIGNPARNEGAVSVLILTGGKISPEAGKVKLDINNVTVANVGSTDRTIVIDGFKPPSLLEQLKARAAPIKAEGDKLFLNGLSVLPADVRIAGEKLLVEIRNDFPGELKRISEGRFQETPDNFWFVTIQPRAESLLVTVRGLPPRFGTSRLKIVEDRRPYSRFKVSSLNDVPEAARIIKAAIRKPK